MASGVVCQTCKDTISGCTSSDCAVEKGERSFARNVLWFAELCSRLFDDNCATVLALATMGFGLVLSMISRPPAQLYVCATCGVAD